MSNHTTMETVSGLRMDLLAPSTESVTGLDIAYSLARINRFNGHTTISVAQHSFEVMMALYTNPSFPLMLPRYLSVGHGLLFALLHDAHEAYTGDISRPMNNAIAGLEGAESPVNSIKRDVQQTIHRYFGLPIRAPHVLQVAINTADRKMLNIDRWLFKMRWESLSVKLAQGQFIRALEDLLAPDSASFVGQYDEWPGTESERSKSPFVDMGQQERTPEEKARGPGDTIKGIDINVGDAGVEKGADA